MTCRCIGLDTLLIEPEVVHLAAAVCVCRQNSRGFVPDLESRAGSNSIQKWRKCHPQDSQSFRMMRETHLRHLHHLKQRRLYEFLPFPDLRWNRETKEPR